MARPARLYDEQGYDHLLHYERLSGVFGQAPFSPSELGPSELGWSLHDEQWYDQNLHESPLMSGSMVSDATSASMVISGTTSSP